MFSQLTNVGRSQQLQLFLVSVDMFDDSYEGHNTNYDYNAIYFFFCNTTLTVDVTSSTDASMTPGNFTASSTWRHLHNPLDDQPFPVAGASSHKSGNGNGSDSISGVIKAELVPVVCAFGLFGNALTLLVLGCEPVRRAASAISIGGGHIASGSGRHRRSGGGGRIPSSTSGSADRTVNVWLKALAVSDFLLCACLLPHSIIGSESLAYDNLTFELVYRTYGGAAINNFMLTSTWLIVSMSVGRYLAVCHPLGIGRLGRVRAPGVPKSAACRIAAVVFVACCLLNIPRFFEHRIDVIRCPEDIGTTAATAINVPPEVATQPRVMYMQVPLDGLTGTSGRTVYAWTHFLVGVVVPLVTVTFCNVRLVNTLRRTGRDLRRDIVYGMSRSGSLRQQQQQQQRGGSELSDERHPKDQLSRTRSTIVSAAAGRRTTTILVAVVLIYLASVTPSEILSFVDE